MTTNASLISEIRALTNDNNSSTDLRHLQDETILQFIQRATNDLCIETDINYRAYEYTHSGTDTDSFTFLTLTGSVETKLYKLDELSIQLLSEGRVREIKRVSYTDNKKINNVDSTTVISCHIYDDTIYFNADITAGDIIYISGRWKKADLTLLGNFSLDSMAEDCVVKYGASMGYYTQTKETLGKIWFDFFTYRKQSIEKYYKDLLVAKDPGAVRVHKKSNSLGIGVLDYGEITP